MFLFPLLGGYVYQSTDGGQNWNTVNALPYAEFWAAVTSDTAGVHLAAAQGYGGSIYYSSDSGVTWINSQFYRNNFVSMCQSSSGEILYAADGGGPGSVFEAGLIYVSYNYGKSWNNTGSPSREWGRIACDSTGQYVTATVYQGQVYTSGDFGETWAAQNITVTPTVISYNDDDATSDSLSGGAIAGIVVGSVALLVVIGLAIAVLVFGVTLPCFASGGAKDGDLLANQM